MQHAWGRILAVGAAVLVAGLWLAHLGAAPRGIFPRVITVNASQWRYAPGVITVHEGDPVTLRLVTNDVTHGFYLDGYGIMREVVPDRVTEVHFVATRAGRWMFRCSTTCGTFHPYMIGWLRVEPNTTLRLGWIVVGVVALVTVYAAWEEARGR